MLKYIITNFLLFFTAVSVMSFTEPIRNIAILYQDEQIRISSAFPNPATQYTSFSYQIYDKQIKANIVITDMIGNNVINFSLDVNQNSARIPVYFLPSGIYFYALYIDGKHKVVSKFIIKSR